MATMDILFVGFSVLLLIYYFVTRRPKNFPPGPRRIPVFGNLFQLEGHRHEQFKKWEEQYGEIFSFYMGSKNFVVLNNYKHIKEAFAELKFSGRDIHNELIKLRNLGDNRGILFSDGETWVEQRRFCLKTLRDFGFGKKSMESMVMEEVQELVEGFKKDTGKPISTQNRFNIAVLNALWQILTGEKIPHDDPRLNNLVRSLTSVIIKRPLTSVLAELFPMMLRLRKLLPWLFNTSGSKFQKATIAMIKEVVEHHKQTFQETTPRDFIDVYLKQIKQTKDTSSSFYGQDGELQLFIVLMDLFAAGAETTSSTLSWAFLFLALHPDKQEKLFQEIKKVTGQSRPVALADKSDLPYLEATITEVLRCSSLVSMALNHRLTEDTVFHGFFLPKDTLIIPNLYNAHNDQSAWNDPKEFRPERFLTADNKYVVKNDAYMPFSTGRRVCLGESLAKDELFLFAGNLFQNLKVSTVPDQPKPKIEAYVTSSLLLPIAHELVVHER